MSPFSHLDLMAQVQLWEAQVAWLATRPCPVVVEDCAGSRCSAASALQCVAQGSPSTRPTAWLGPSWGAIAHLEHWLW